LTVTTTDCCRQADLAVVGLTVTDDSVLEMIEKREQRPRLPVMVLLESDVRDLADAHVYLDDANPKAPLATDLLLGTQGWRRFATIKTSDFVAERRRCAARAGVARADPTGARDRGRASRRDLAARFEDRLALRDGVALDACGSHAASSSASRRRFLQERRAAAQKAELEHPKLKTRLAQFEAKQEDKALLAKPGDAASRVSSADAARCQAQAIFVVRSRIRPRRPRGSQAQRSRRLRRDALLERRRSHRRATGQASISFATSDAVTSFRVVADAFDQGGSLATRRARSSRSSRSTPR
jgi:hypothetical protein